MMNKIIEQLNPIEVLGLTIIGEARGEPIEGQVAVASVIRNRMQSDIRKYKTIKDVCLEPHQFSCWNYGDKNFDFIMVIAEKMLNKEPINDPYIKQCMLIAEGIISWSILDNTKGKLHYIEENLFIHKRPNWAKNVKPGQLKFGHHIFFDI